MNFSSKKARELNKLSVRVNDPERPTPMFLFFMSSSSTARVCKEPNLNPDDNKNRLGESDT